MNQTSLYGFNIKNKVTYNFQAYSVQEYHKLNSNIVQLPRLTRLKMDGRNGSSGSKWDAQPGRAGQTVTLAGGTAGRLTWVRDGWLTMAGPGLRRLGMAGDGLPWPGTGRDGLPWPGLGRLTWAYWIKLVKNCLRYMSGIMLANAGS